jgi:transcriptional regulator with XRE-family HTH domain
VAAITPEGSDFTAGWRYDGGMSTTARTVGDVLRAWRRRRHVSQLDLAVDTGVSPRHLSFIETGRSHASREMLLRLADGLDLPLRERNALLVAGGFAPVYPERPFSDPALAPVRQAVDLVLAGHEPCPALAVDRWWTLVAANAAAGALLQMVDPSLREPPVNVLRLCFHPDGLVPRIVNRDEVLPALLARLGHEIAVTGDARLEALRDELRGYPVMRDLRAVPAPSSPAIVVPFELDTGAVRLRFMSATTVFGTPADVTVSELAIESFFPADAATADAMRALARAAADAP